MLIIIKWLQKLKMKEIKETIITSQIKEVKNQHNKNEQFIMYINIFYE